ncbi:hypothetical protein HD554DRAFT_1521361 [Boletus coccyginus]|nr:hypothetical protein HD554DRAFT_1521361 [Boletus coccyginus]
MLFAHLLMLSCIDAIVVWASLPLRRPLRTRRRIPGSNVKPGMLQVADLVTLAWKDHLLLFSSSVIGYRGPASTSHCEHRHPRSRRGRVTFIRCIQERVTVIFSDLDLRRGSVCLWPWVGMDALPLRPEVFLPRGAGNN